ncbi:AarF/ABC1/UbiB kinase family protein [Sphaerospermopsis aphanizomenoides BCCUSP55]|uniref:ABC1 kinase family protein n=1 Tax=Sphaerospermopsis aphanizomenoides TaxID=459663 RepID=UPI0019071227|nr:AarF/ABC1/UbiB kinase family protein [Sphaerospermopsis aphanizomenoides]MBK1987690.1 AarF/ABC1/UbiB kinase family protein [Sphaerospermopsis aphanizomenoides BCCUSP55]
MNHSTVPLPDNLANIANHNHPPGKLWSRRLQILTTFLLFGILLLWDWLTRRLQRNQQLRAKILVQKLIQLGPTFIKFGQVLSCRPDLIPPIYVDQLAHLQDKLPPFPNEQAYEVIEAEFGCPYHQIYAELNPEPVAAASLGQVYKGKLQTGEIVAVKVQRPGIIDILVLDIYLLQQLSTWVQKNIPFIHTNIRALTDELANSIFKEMDYVQEGLNGQKFAQLYGNLPQIYVPRIYLKYTTSRVLTMEWVNGEKITSTEVTQRQGLNPADLIAVEFKFALQQLLSGGFFHADPHPGNVLVTPEGKLAYLDFGMMSEVTPETRDLLIIFFLHLVSGDFPSLAEDLVSLEFLPPETDLAPLIPKLAQMFGNIRETSIAEFGFKQMFDNLLSLIYEYSWQIPKFYVLVFRCFATLEGIALKLNPDFQAYKVGYPYISQWVLTKRSPVLWTALNKFCLNNKTMQWDVVSDLLNNIYQSEDFNLYLTSERMLEFLYSPQGDPLRHVLVNEVVTKVENFSKETFEEMMMWTRAITTPFPNMAKLNKNWENIQPFIGKFLLNTPSNLPSIYELSQLFLRPEAKRLVQEIVNKLGMRILKQFIPA